VTFANFKLCSVHFKFQNQIIVGHPDYRQTWGQLHLYFQM